MIENERRPPRMPISERPLEPAILADTPPPPDEADADRRPWECATCKVPIARAHRDTLYASARKDLAASFERRLERERAEFKVEIDRLKSERDDTADRAIKKTIDAVMSRATPPPTPSPPDGVPRSFVQRADEIRRQFNATNRRRIRLK